MIGFICQPLRLKDVIICEAIGSKARHTLCSEGQVDNFRPITRDLTQATEAFEVDNQRSTKTLRLDLYQPRRLRNYAVAMAKEALFLDLQLMRSLTSVRPLNETTSRQEHKEGQRWSVYTASILFFR
jgi:hypothetical protein